MPTVRPLPTVIGPTENALRAVLERIRGATPIGDYSSWVVLNAADRAAAGDHRLRTAVTVTTERLVEGIDPTETAVTRSVLDRVRERAERLLTSAEPLPGADRQISRVRP